MSEETTHGGCSECGRTDVGLKKDGTLRMHVHAERKGNSFLATNSGRCDGAGKPPKRTQYGVRFILPDGPVFAESSREKAEAAIENRGHGVLVAIDYVGAIPTTDWYKVTE